MPNVTSVITRAIRKRLDWNTIGIAISVLIVTIAVVILVRLLRDIDVDKVIDALRAKSIEQISIAGAFVAVAYFALTFYDFFALRTIGRGEVPYRIAALASFTKKCEADAKTACEKASADKKLAGAAKASFEKKCIADATGKKADETAAAKPEATTPAKPAETTPAKPADVAVKKPDAAPGKN